VYSKRKAVLYMASLDTPSMPYLETTLFHGPRNFEPSHRICHLQRNFRISAELQGIWQTLIDRLSINPDSKLTWESALSLMLYKRRCNVSKATAPPVNDLGVLLSLRLLLPLLLLLIQIITRSAAHHVWLSVTDLLQQQARTPRYRRRFERAKKFSKVRLHHRHCDLRLIVIRQTI